METIRRHPLKGGYPWRPKFRDGVFSRSVPYTDGVTGARSPVDELFTRSRLKSIITQPFASAGELIERVKSSVFSFIDVAPRYDDVTMLAVQRTGGGLAA
jgi:hypothetical protein